MTTLVKALAKVYKTAASYFATLSDGSAVAFTILSNGILQGPNGPLSARTVNKIRLGTIKVSTPRRTRGIFSSVSHGLVPVEDNSATGNDLRPLAVWLVQDPRFSAKEGRKIWASIGDAYTTKG